VTAFSKAWRETGRAEGGYVNDPKDSGGETNHGITKRVARANGYFGPMRDLSPRKAETIAKKAYWDVMMLDEIAEVDEDIAHELFDTGFNTGTNRASRFLQRSLNALNRQGADYPDLVVDGRIGSKSASALDAFVRKRRRDGRKVMLRALNGLQLAFYIKLVERREKDEKFLYGWILQRVVM